MSGLKALQEKIDNLTLRERGIIFLGILYVLYTGWDMFLMQPLAVEQKKIEAELKQKQATQLGLNARIQKLIMEQDKDPNAVNRGKVAQLKKRIAEVESQMQASTAQLVHPENMAKILETVLHSIKGLELVEVKSLGATALIKKDPKQAQKDKEPASGNDLENAYKHGLKIVFEGDYMSTLDYIRRLEELEWKFFWDSFELEVKEYPVSRAAITLFTLSMDKNWIGI